MPGGGFRRVLAEWPLLAAALALLSLALLPRLARPGPADDPRALDALRQSSPGPETESDLREFLAAHPQSAHAPEVRLLLARSIAGRAEKGDFPGPRALDEAWGLTADLEVREAVARELYTRGLARPA